MTHEPIREHIAFHKAHIPSNLRLKLMEHFYPKLSDTTESNYSKQAVLRASDYIETTYWDVRILMQLTQCRVFIWHFNDI